MSKGLEIRRIITSEAWQILDPKKDNVMMLHLCEIIAKKSTVRILKLIE